MWTIPHLSSTELSSSGKQATNGARPDARVKKILKCIDDAVEALRSRDDGIADTDDDLRKEVIEKLIGHKYFRYFREEGAIHEHGPADKDLMAIVAAIKEMNEWLCTPGVKNSAEGLHARQVLVAAMAGNGVSYGALAEAIGPLGRDYFKDCSARRKHALTNRDAAEL